ncbi:dolichyl-phosphate-mannose-glycolipid alpha-mannosyltransferase [Cryptosporidium sp. chipmunk genotype I]|uniref:dolichyl-phosphate-mannose-glycolipid alpha-mannosyltransferase n=1 Tax=Cryptosporidium sp. chipmunk genotype I TaxID=1280935 RepID=UPI00351A9B64|nr:dolichyl-phosphate-mannose-glycolipid alpha-mannosyltransferase [Cryptosporidium sp. chipmunk genotype I]
MILIIVIAFRVLNSLIICTTYNPDEYWQSLEIAHKIVNKFGYLTWEWEPCVSLRSIIHPLIFTLCYIIINFLKKIGEILCGNNYQYFYCTSYYFIVPRLFQSIFAILTDLGTGKVAYLILHKKYYLLMETKIEDSDKVKEGNHKFNRNNFENLVLFNIQFYQKICNKYELDFVTLFISLFSWYNFYTLCRTYAQTVENCINIWSIYFIIKSEESIINGNYLNKKFLLVGVLLSSLSVLVRHSSIQFWIVFYLILLFVQFKDVINKGCKYSSLTIIELLKTCIIIASIAIPVMFYSDYLFYRKFTIPMINFVKFNLIGDPGQIYGSNSKLYYFTETPVVTLLSYLPLLILGITDSFNSGSQILKISQISTLITMIFLSTTSHKELRFIIPYFPIILITVGLGVYKVITEIQNSFKMGHNNSVRLLSSVKISRLFINKKYILATLLIQIIPAFFFTTIFQRGGESAVKYLSNLNLQKNDSIFFVSQCHMYPAYSYLNRDVKFGFFDCSPPINQANQLKNLNEILWTHPNTTQFLEEIFVLNPLLNPSYPSPYISSSIPMVENTSNSDNCLNYRFNTKLSGNLPTYFVIHSHFNENLQDWLQKHNYKLISKVFDSFFAETPIGLVFWSYFYIYRKV